ncbi:MAG: PRC-barrel domain-containing protein [Candidatus Woesearchaeota archaeon]
MKKDFSIGKKEANPSYVQKYLHKKVLSKKGATIGRVNDIQFNENTITALVVIGVRRLIIEWSLIEKVTEDAIFLSIDPISELLNKQVIGPQGKKMGKVVDLIRVSNANTFTHLVVKQGIFQKPIDIEKEKIKVANENILLQSETENGNNK